MNRQFGISHGASHDRNSKRTNRTHVPLIMVGEINIFNNTTQTTQSPKNKGPKDSKRIKTVNKKGRRDNDSPYIDTD